jgi:hypothetical protein
MWIERGSGEKNRKAPKLRQTVILTRISAGSLAAKLAKTLALRFKLVSNSRLSFCSELEARNGFV